MIYVTEGAFDGGIVPTRPMVLATLTNSGELYPGRVVPLMLTTKKMNKRLRDVKIEATYSVRFCDLDEPWLQENYHPERRTREGLLTYLQSRKKSFTQRDRVHMVRFAPVEVEDE